MTSPAKFAAWRLCLLCLGVIAILPVQPLHGQAQVAGDKNLFPNGDFDKFTSRPALWYGVDTEGYLAGAKGNAMVLSKGGGLANMPMPVSVSLADINGDGLPDLVTADPAGYLRAYINEGTKTEPKFTHCEMIPFFLSRYVKMLGDIDRTRWSELGRRGVQRINLHDWSRRGMNDLLIGDYGGQIFFFPNMGSATAPNFNQPEKIDDGLISTGPGGSLWGTLFSPVAYGWSKNGKTDLLIGEGSYSANAVHLLTNRGAGSKPEFGQEARYYLAYGDGREQLVPAVVDYNGDGAPDLLVADREGTVGVYICPDAWKPGDELQYYSNVTFGTVTSFAAPVTIDAGDINGDGLFDVIIGKNNGRIALAINKGTKEQPKFDAPVEITGGSEFAKNTINVPDSWQCDSGYGKGNIYGYFSVVGPEDKNSASRSAHVLKAGYFPCPNKVFKVPDLAMVGVPPDNGLMNANDRGIGFKNVTDRNFWTPTKTFMLHITPTAQLKTGSTYTVSFNVKGRDVKDGHWVMCYGAHKENAPAQIQRGDRGSAIVTHDFTNEANIDASGAFSAGTSWTTISRTFTVKFKESKLKDIDATTTCGLEISFMLTSYDGTVYIDDVRLTEKN